MKEQYEVQVWHGTSDATSPVTRHLFATLIEALNYFHDNKGRMKLIQLIDNTIVFSKGESF